MKLFVAAIVLGIVAIVSVMWAMLTGHGGLAVLLMLSAVAGGAWIAIAAQRARTTY